MHEESLLRDLVLLVGCAIPIVALAQKLRIASVVGFLTAGILIGPHGLGLVANPTDVSELAEIGAVLLLFTIGLELSLSRLMQMGATVLRAGLLQVAGTLAVGTVGALLLGIEMRRALFYGALVALSSTAVVLKLYSERAELDTPHGRVAVAILLFQDLAVVPLMLLVPILANATEPGLGTLTAIAKSVAVVGGLLAAGKFLIPAVLDRVVLLKNRELFTFSIGFIGLGAAFVTAGAGLSLALGSFLAGLAISESRYGLQALSDALPFRDAFAGVFFLSVGMLVDLGHIAGSLIVVLALTLGVILVKAAIASVVILTLPRGVHPSLIAGLRLAQVGEFSFVLAAVSLPFGLFGDGHYQTFLSTSVVSLLATPLLFHLSDPIARRLAPVLRPTEIEMQEPESFRSTRLEDHAIIVGFGLSGRHLARVLHASGVAYVVLEQNGQLVARAREEGLHVVFGDGTRRDVLEHVAASRARVIVFTISSPSDERRGIAIASEISPAARKVVRTKHVLSIEDLRQLGASDVIVEEFEATLELFSRVLECYEVPSNVIYRELEAVRAEQYGFLREEAQASDLKLDKLRHLRIHSALELVEIEEGAAAIGESPASIALRERTGAIVVAVVRAGRPVYPTRSGFLFRQADTVVLVGDADSLARASEYFRAPSPATSIDASSAETRGEN